MFVQGKSRGGGGGGGGGRERIRTGNLYLMKCDLQLIELHIEDTINFSFKKKKKKNQVLKKIEGNFLLNVINIV
jgi:hypothetical protein